MQTQNYTTHRKIPMSHWLTYFVLTLLLIGSTVNLYMSLGNHDRLYSASLILVIVLLLTAYFFTLRGSALRAQDRAIRAEENLRHFVLTGKLLDKKITIGQVIALRFAPDEEFVELAKLAVEKNMSKEEIKKAIKSWKADNHRA
jgi:hypothetical protein